jgi:serine/threonine-protein kinase
LSNEGGAGEGSELVSSVRVGDLLSGKYRIERVLGAGGMGVVVAAHHLQLDERVAIKFLLPEGLKNPEALARFEREARAAVKIKNEHVARTIDVGKLENGAPYIVMEYLEGTDLANLLRSRRSLAIDEAVEFLLQASEAIAEAHALGIIHRDLKLENLFVVRRADGLMSVKVLDFGISKVTGLAGSGRDVGMTRTSTIMGSPLYMSPEQLHSTRDVDTRTDIWALGVILYELIAGHPPFIGDSMPELVAKILTRPPEPLLNLRPDAPQGLENVILRCLEKDKANRYGNIAELAMALVEFGPRRARASAERISRTVQAAGLSASALALPPSSDLSEPPKVGTMASWGQTAPQAGGGRRGLWGVVAVVALVLVGGGAMLLLRKPAVTSTSTLVAPPPAETAAAIAPPAEVPTPVPPAPAAPSASAGSAPSPPVAAPEKPHIAPRGAPVTRLPPPAPRPPTAPPTTTKPGDLGGRY